jgi:hypothetical protein
MARESLLAHLIKLEGEGGAERRESGWAPGPPSRGSGATGYT